MQYKHKANPQEAEETDEEHGIKISKFEGLAVISLEHEMSKTHYISFIAYVTLDCMGMKKLYPEQSPEADLFSVIFLRKCLQFRKIDFI